MGRTANKHDVPVIMISEGVKPRKGGNSIETFNAFTKSVRPISKGVRGHHDAELFNAFLQPVRFESSY